jgi:hypothetical protein
MWKLHHGRGHAWDDVGKETARDDYTRKRCKTILQQCEVPDWAESWAVSQIFSKNLNGFNRHYAGSDGACIGFALVSMYDSSDDAEGTFFARRAAEVIVEFEAEDIRNLLDYTFRKYGGEN